MSPFSEGLRYEYPIQERDLVIDAGAHLGNFSREIGRKYNCEVWAFEPVQAFWEQARKEQGPKTKVLRVGLGGEADAVEFKVHGDQTGLYASDPAYIELVSIVPVSLLYGFSNIALLKLNIEGGEFEVLERLLADGKATLFRNIQVQFHRCAPNAGERREIIQTGLRRTHELTWSEPWIWENWRLKDV